MLGRASRIWQGDSRELISRLPDASVDLICTDPPYNLGGYSTGNIKMAWRSDFNNDVADWDQIAFDPEEWLAPFRRVLKPTGTLFAFTSYNLLGRWHEVFDPAFDTFQFIVWHKTNPPPKLRRAGFLNSCELIVCCWDRGHTWNFGRQRDMHNFIEAPICGGNERVRDPVHPTQKPLRVVRRLLELASGPGRPRARSVHGRRARRVSPRSRWAGASSGSRSTRAMSPPRSSGSRQRD